MVPTLREAAGLPTAQPHASVLAVGAGHPWAPAAHALLRLSSGIEMGQRLCHCCPVRSLVAAESSQLELRSIRSTFDGNSGRVSNRRKGSVTKGTSETGCWHWHCNDSSAELG